MTTILLHVFIAYVAMTAMSVMDIIMQIIVDPPKASTLSIFGMNQKSLKKYFDSSTCQYILIKFTESIKFTVKYANYIVSTQT